MKAWGPNFSSLKYGTKCWDGFPGGGGGGGALKLFFDGVCASRNPEMGVLSADYKHKI